MTCQKPKIVRGSSSFVINADSCIVKVQGFIYFTLTCRISPPHLTSSGTVFFLTPQLLLRRRSARCARLPPAQSLCHVYYDEFFGSPQKKFANERGFDFLDRQTDGRTDRNFVEILGKLCFARLKLNLKTEDRFKLKTKLGYSSNVLALLLMLMIFLQRHKTQNWDETKTATAVLVISKH